MADSTKLPVGAWSPLYVVVYALGSVTAQVFLGYKRYVGSLKWPTAVLFAYVIALAVVHVPWGEAMRGLLIPKVEFNGAFLTTLIAIQGQAAPSRLSPQIAAGLAMFALISAAMRCSADTARAFAIDVITRASQALAPSQNAPT